ncbi:MAG: branched-chain amino acid ABC transporter permease [Bradyrhizobium sp.]|jgi:branched-chain amino acid transport system permease protein|uniref:branched-chain amino acid ABC transporter permease n=1 Tax=Bradyrhizobium TaxID=374 RepID=UPI000462D465|nr:MULTISPECIES: branched-chain amino acid ABC transporter permease [Bradyrhizobium]MBJ7403803.1 branched-chain amino acid ABC transporter permease [Bradyrhizobium sp.]
MDMFLQVVVSGIVVGCVYGMAALGFTIVYNATKIINFANGEFMMLGGVLLAGLVAAAKVPIPVGILAAIAGCALVGWVLQRGVLDGARNSDPLTLVMLTIGSALALRGAAALAFGRDVSFVPEFGVLPLVLLGNVYIPSQGLWIIMVLVVVSAALWYVFSRTMLGKAMRAASQEPRAAALCGIEPRRTAALAMIMAGSIGGLAGAMLAPMSAAFYENGIFLGLKGFAAAVAGGLGNPLGAVVGGLLIGLVESLTSGFVASGFKDAVSFMLLILVLILRPQGLVGKAVVRRV